MTLGGCGATVPGGIGPGASLNERTQVRRQADRIEGGRWFALTLAVFVAGCASSGGSERANVRYGASTPEQALAGFLDAANVEDYDRMGRLFGTQDGPAEAEYGIAETEQRMIVISSLIRHQTYTLREQNLAGLGDDRVRYVVTMSGTRKGTVPVPVVLTHTADGSWFVEWLELEAIAGGI